MPFSLLSKGQSIANFFPSFFPFCFVFLYLYGRQKHAVARASVLLFYMSLGEPKNSKNEGKYKNKERVRADQSKYSLTSLSGEGFSSS